MYHKHKYNLYKYSEIHKFLDTAPPLFLNESIEKKPKIGIVKTHGLNNMVDYVLPTAPWLQYERFCKNNNIPYEFYEISKSNWLEEAQKFDIILCHVNTSPAYIEMVQSKIYVLEKCLNKYCFPSFHEIWQYENKNRASYLYKYYNLPAIPTYTTNNVNDAYDIIEKINYPFIFKNSTGASSSGVKKINSKAYAKKLLEKIFGKKGIGTHYPYYFQKDYLYAQEFIADASFDLRIMLIGNMAFGYYRYPDKGDFRASGSGLIEKRDIPKDAILLAIEARNKLKSRQLGVDLLYSQKHNKYMIIETSLFNRIETPEQLIVDGKPGYYDITDTNNIVFMEGKFWVQELVLRDLVVDWFRLYKNQKDD